jgi:ComF family protein
MFEGRIDGEFECPNCHGLKFAFEFARPAMRRDERTLEMVHRLKYQRGIHLASELGGLAYGAMKDPRFAPAIEGGWPLVPVPLHRARLRWRHFNQSAEIARGLSACCGLPVVSVLKRVRATETQTHLSRAQRLANLKKAFVLTKAGKNLLDSAADGVVLVDDVLTTGSTAHACALALRNAGFRRVFVLTVMRG